MSAEEVYEELGLKVVEQEGTKTQMCFQGCSAMTGDGVWEGIKQLSDCIKKAEEESGQNQVSIENKTGQSVK